MANQTLTTGVTVNHDDPSVLGLLNGEDYIINGGNVIINGDVRWGQNSAVIGNMTISTTLGGTITFDGRDIWEIPFDASTGNVPTLGTLDTNGVLGGTSGASGELFRVWADGEIEPRVAGGAMPTSGYIKLRTKSGTFEDNETVTLPGGATITVNSSTGGKRSWIHIVGERQQTITVPRLGSLSAYGDWYYLPDTDGTDNQIISLPFIDEIPAVQIETSAGSGIYEWWINAGQRWQTGHGISQAYISTDDRGKFFGQIIRDTTASTTTGSNLVTVTSTTGMVVGSPIVFSAGFTDNDNLYISQIVSATEIRVSTNSNATGSGRTIITFRNGIQLAFRGAFDCGKKPESGCKVRVPNIIVSTGTAGPADSNSWRGQISEGVGTDRWDVTTTASGAVYLDKVMDCAYLGATSAAYSAEYYNVANFNHSHANTATEVILENCACGISRGNAVTTVSCSNQFTGVTISNLVAARYNDSSNAHAVTLTDCANVSLSDLTLTYWGSVTTNNDRTQTNIRTILLTRCFDVTMNNINSIGAGIGLVQVTRATLTNITHADKVNGTTNTVNAVAGVAISDTSSSIVLNGFSNFANISDVHPYSAIVTTATSVANVEVRNIGTSTIPYNMGTANACGVIISSTVSLNITLRRCYVENTRTSAVSFANTVQNVLLENVWGDGADTQAIPAVAALCKGCRWTNSTAGQTAVYGRHWEDAWVSTDIGRFLIACNEPLDSTASQAVATFSPGSGYTSAGNVSMIVVNDNVVWEQPYFAIGHTSFSPVDTITPFLITGTNVSNHKYDYQIDKGSGFSSWKRLLTVAVRTSGGTSGSNTFVMVAKPEDYPQIGDYIQSTTAGRLPTGTTVTNVVGETITVSNNFLVNLGANEILYTWKDIQDETGIDPTVGVKLKVRATVITASDTNALTYIRINSNTNSTDQQLQYPLPEVGIDFTNLVTGSQVVVYESGTTTILGSTNNSGTEYNFIAPELPVTVDYTVLKGGYEPLRSTGITITDETLSLSISQKVDREYNSSHGLTYGSDWSVNISGGTIDVSSATTGRNIYSALMDAYIDRESNTANTVFPLTMDGNTSLTLNEMEFTPSSINFLSRTGFRYLENAVLTSEYAAIQTPTLPASTKVWYLQEDGGTWNLLNTGTGFDGMIQVYGDATHGNFDYTNFLALKATGDGYTLSEWDVISDGGVSIVDDNFYFVPLSITLTGVTAGDPGALDVTVNNISATSWNGITVGQEVVVGNTVSGEDVVRYLTWQRHQGNLLEYGSLVAPLGDNFQSKRGRVYDGTPLEIEGCRVVLASDGVTPHPDFVLFEGNTGTYSPPVTVFGTVTVEVTGSRLQVYNLTTATELANEIVSGGTWSLSQIFESGTYWSAGDQIRLRATYYNGLNATKKATTTLTIGSNENWNASIDQETCPVYATYGIDGATVTEFAWDGTNVEFDVDDPDNIFYVSRLFAWDKYHTYSEVGIRDAFNYITSVDAGNIQISNDAALDNLKSQSAVQGDTIRLFRPNGTLPVATPTTGGGGFSFYSTGTIYVVETGVSGLTVSESEQLAKIEIIEKLAKLIPAAL